MAAPLKGFSQGTRGQFVCALLGALNKSELTGGPKGIMGGQGGGTGPRLPDCLLSPLVRAEDKMGVRTHQGLGSTKSCNWAAAISGLS